MIDHEMMSCDVIPPSVNCYYTVNRYQTSLPSHQLGIDMISMCKRNGTISNFEGDG